MLFLSLKSPCQVDACQFVRFFHSSAYLIGFGGCDGREFIGVRYGELASGFKYAGVYPVASFTAVL